MQELTLSKLKKIQSQKLSWREQWLCQYGKEVCLMACKRLKLGLKNPEELRKTVKTVIVILEAEAETTFMNSKELNRLMEISKQLVL